MIERRKSRRFELDVPLELWRSPGNAEKCETTNLSSAGVLFRSAAALDPGDPVEFLITLPAAVSGVEVRVRCRGKVVRRGAEGEFAATMERWEFVRQSVVECIRRTSDPSE